MTEELLDLNDPICAACETGGNMICCDGKCLRSFHPKCIGMKAEDIPDDCPFVCADCWNGIQRCFKCKYFDIEQDLVKCAVPYCGKFYHAKCMDNENSKNICNLHRCHDCKEEILDFKKKKDLHKCFRCPKAFDLRHRPRDVHVLGNEYFLCIRHVNEEENLPELGKDIQEKMEKRKLDRVGSKAQGSSSRPVIRKTARPIAGSSVESAGGAERAAPTHALPPRIGARVAVRAPPSAPSAPSAAEADLSRAAVAASEASITIARRKRPAVVPAERPPPAQARGGGALHSGGADMGHSFHGHMGGYDHHHPYDHYPAPHVEPHYSIPRASNMFFHGGGGHFLRATDSYTYEEEYIAPRYDGYSAGPFEHEDSSSEYDFRKRARFGGGFDMGYGDYGEYGGGSGRMGRAEDMRQFGMPEAFSPHWGLWGPGAAEPSYGYDYPPAPPEMPRGLSGSSGMGRTAALLVESAVPSYAPPYSSNGGAPSATREAAVSQPAAAPAAKAPEPKKIDPNDLFALLSANGLF